MRQVGHREACWRAHKRHPGHSNEDTRRVWNRPGNWRLMDIAYKCVALSGKINERDVKVFHKWEYYPSIIKYLNNRSTSWVKSLAVVWCSGDVLAINGQSYHRIIGDLRLSWEPSIAWQRVAGKSQIKMQVKQWVTHPWRILQQTMFDYPALLPRNNEDMDRNRSSEQAFSVT